MKIPKPVAFIDPLAELAATAVGVKGAIMSQVPLLENVLSV